MLKLDPIPIRQEYVKKILGQNLIFKINPKYIQKQVKKECYIGNDWLQQKAFFEYFFIGGDWEDGCTLIENDLNYIEMKQLLIFREKFRESPAYLSCVKEFYDGRPQKGCDGNYFNSILKIDETFSYYLGLIKSMASKGYLQDLPAPNKEGEEYHIGVAIGQAGELFHFRTGHHRLAISKLLNLDSIFIQVHCVHTGLLRNLVKDYGPKEIKETGNIIRNFVKGMNYEA